MYTKWLWTLQNLLPNVKLPHFVLAEVRVVEPHFEQAIKLKKVLGTAVTRCRTVLLDASTAEAAAGRCRARTLVC